MPLRQLVRLAMVMLLLSACSATKPPPTDDPAADDGPSAPRPPTPAPTIAPAPTAVPVPTAVPSPTPRPRVLTICLGSEPDSLAPDRAAGYAARLIQAAIYDGPIDTVGYEPRPVILEKIPSLAGGDAVLQPVPVQPGDRVLSDAGEPITLTLGVRVRPAGCREPGCAVEYDGGLLDMDQLSATFRLLPGLLWSDGSPLAAADSVRGFDAARVAGSTAQRADLVARTASYAALDELKALWVGLPGYLAADYRTTFFSPLPDQEPAAGDGGALPLGWGPFTLADWLPGQRIVAERNPNYFRADEGLPYFDRLVFEFAGQDVESNLAALQAGRCDVLAADALAGADLDRLLALRAAGELELYRGPVSTWEQLAFGIDPAPGSSGERPDFFQDARVRRAIGQCIDRQGLAGDVYGGQAAVMAAYAPPAHPLYAEAGLEPLPYDAAAGRALLDEVGWRDADADGVREASGVEGIADGTRLAVRFQAPASPVRERLVGHLAANLAACGVAVTLSLPAPAEFFAGGEAGLLYGRHFDLAELAWIAGPDLPCELFLSSAIPGAANGWSGSNVSGYASPAFDAACRAALAALPGTPEHTAAHVEALRLFAQDLPVLPLLARFQLSAARPDLLGLQSAPGAAPETWNVEELRLGP